MNQERVKNYGKMAIYGMASGLLFYSLSLTGRLYNNSNNFLISLVAQGAGLLTIFNIIPYVKAKFDESVVNELEEQSRNNKIAFPRSQDTLYQLSFCGIASLITIKALPYTSKFNNKWLDLIIGPVTLGVATAAVAYDFYKNEGTLITRKADISSKHH